jgi:hypothetical protein
MQVKQRPVAILRILSNRPFKVTEVLMQILLAVAQYGIDVSFKLFIIFSNTNRLDLLFCCRINEGYNSGSLFSRNCSIKPLFLQGCF